MSCRSTDIFQIFDRAGSRRDSTSIYLCFGDYALTFLRMVMHLYRRLSPAQSRYLTEDRESIYLPLMVTIGSSYPDSSMKRVLGVMRITGKKRDRSFTEMDLHLLTVVAGHIGLSMHSYLEMGQEIDARVQASLRGKCHFMICLINLLSWYWFFPTPLKISLKCILNNLNNVIIQTGI